MSGKSTTYLLIAWIVTGVVRVLLGSSTSVVAYLFFVLFWLISAILLAAAIRQLVTAKASERRIEAVCLCAGVVSLLVQGLLGDGEAIAAALLLFLASACVLLGIYARRLWRSHIAHPSH